MSAELYTHARHAAISGVGVYLPADVITNADLASMVETSDTWIMERTGIRNRHRAGSGETVAQMGAQAARKAMLMANTTTVDVIICATCSPDTLFPSAACLIQRELGLAPIPAFDLNAVCSGYVYALQVAKSLVEGGGAGSVLVVAAEAMTRLVDYGDRSTCVLFGDGAGASVVSQSSVPGIRAVQWGADGGQAELIYFGPKQDAATPKDAIRMEGRGTFRLAVDRLCATAEELAAACRWSLKDIDHFIPHQANLRIIEATAKRLNIPMDKVFVDVEDMGNTSAASISLALADAYDSGRLKRGDKVVCAAFGAGATWGGVALEWTL